MSGFNSTGEILMPKMAAVPQEIKPIPAQSRRFLDGLLIELTAPEAERLLARGEPLACNFIVHDRNHRPLGLLDKMAFFELTRLIRLRKRIARLANFGGAAGIGVIPLIPLMGAPFTTNIPIFALALVCLGCGAMLLIRNEVASEEVHEYLFARARNRVARRIRIEGLCVSGDVPFGCRRLINPGDCPQ